MGDWPIIKQIADIFGLVMRGLFLLTSAMGIENIALCVVLFVAIYKMISLPYEYKKRKFALVLPKLNHESELLKEKYQNKKDHPLAQNKLNIDKGFALDRYGLKAASGCAPTLIQLPVLFALYAVVQNVPRYVPELATMSEEKLTSVYSLFSLSVLDAPGFEFGPAFVFPVLCALLQLAETVYMSHINKVANNGKLVGGISNALMLAMTFYFATKFPLILSVYWISKSCMDIISLMILQAYLNPKPLIFFETARVKQKNKDRAKRGLSLLEMPMGA